MDSVTYAFGIDYGFIGDAQHNNKLPTYVQKDIEATMSMYTAKYFEEEEKEVHRIEVLEAEIARLQKERAMLARFPKDNFGEGTVIRFDRVFGGSWEEMQESGVEPNVYSYAAIKTNGLWYLTGSGNGGVQRQRYSWNALIEWLGAGVKEMWLCVEAADLLGTRMVHDFQDVTQRAEVLLAPAVDPSTVHIAPTEVDGTEGPTADSDRTNPME